MSLEESDLDRIADKIELAVTRSIDRAMNDHITRTHEPKAERCEKRFKDLEDHQAKANEKLVWATGAFAGLMFAWEYLRKKVGL